MITEKEFIFNILKKRGVVTAEGRVDKDRFKKLITEDWLWQKSIKYNFITEEKKEEVVEIEKETVVTEEAPVAQEVNLTELPAEEVSVTEENPVEATEEAPKKTSKRSKK